ncbi:hypothetical protein V6N12_065173 [Hibiscus sabdariffa]|uniref:Endonuclease/exonuclease/phosphatase domain-containing protein n=1 Tax=Hibiscus sabdariffa TaxID=183260 RepID=A0ABR2G8A1_9ROSI
MKKFRVSIINLGSGSLTSPGLYCLGSGSLTSPGSTAWVQARSLPLLHLLLLRPFPCVHITILSATRNVIDVSVSLNGESPWFCSFVYAPPYREGKQDFWKDLTNTRADIDNPWLLMGDTNIISSQNDKIGGSPYDLSQAKWFNEFTDLCGLMDMPIKGGTYTWSNLRADDDAILERIDNVLFNTSWNDMFNKADCFMDPAIFSDHCPVILRLYDHNKKRRRAFKFESNWLLEKGCKSSVQEAWNQLGNNSSGLLLNRKLNIIREKLRSWSKGKFARKRKTLKEIRDKIKVIQSTPLTFESAEEVKKLKEELDKF